MHVFAKPGTDLLKSALVVEDRTFPPCAADVRDSVLMGTLFHATHEKALLTRMVFGGFD
jgi:hypothetical protein